MSQTERTETTVFVGCGAEKQNSPAPARDLYTSSYFQKKCEYAETVGDSWAILSALYGSVAPKSRTRPYDVTIDDYPLDVEERSRAKYTTVEEWATSILEGVENRIHNLDRWDERDPLGRIVVLAGRKYVEPLREGLDALTDEHGFEVVYPFDDTSGIGDQIGWLTERIEAAEEQDTGVSAGSEVDPDPDDGEADLGATPNEDADTTEASGPEQADLAGFASKNSGE
jgi:hypothetical protein